MCISQQWSVSIFEFVRICVLAFYIVYNRLQEKIKRLLLKKNSKITFCMRALTTTTYIAFIYDWHAHLAPIQEYNIPRTTDTQWRHKSKISEKLGRCGRQNMFWPYLKIWDWDWIFGRAVKATSSLGVRSPWVSSKQIEKTPWKCCFLK